MFLSSLTDTGTHIKLPYTTSQAINLVIEKAIIAAGLWLHKNADYGCGRYDDRGRT
jgi:hypothetical protein